MPRPSGLGAPWAFGRPGETLVMAAGGGGAPRPAPAPGPARWVRVGPSGNPPAAILGEAPLERGGRFPADLLRCIIALVEIGLLAGLGLLARATASGAETDLVLASLRLPKALLPFLGYAAHAALLLLPVALAIRVIIRRQPRRPADGAGP